MIGIIGAMNDELASFIKIIEQKSEKAYHSFKVIEGKVKDKDIVVFQTGIGRTAASVATTLLLEKYDVEAIINVGSCGGVDFTDRIGDIILGEKIYYGDVDLTAFKYQYGQMSGCEPYFNSNEKLMNDFLEKSKDDHIKKGNVISFDRFVNDSDFLYSIIDNYFTTVNFKGVDMESGAIAHVCKIYNKPLLVIKVISDIVGSGTQSDDFYKFMQLISDKLSNLLYNFI